MGLQCQLQLLPIIRAALIFAILFGITTFLHIYQAYTHKKLKLCWVLIMGATWEFASFAIRTASTKNQQSIPSSSFASFGFARADVGQRLCIYGDGADDLLLHSKQRIFGVKASKVAKIFVWLDIASFLTQVGGGVMIQPGADAKTVMLGIHIYMGGIGFQEFCILLFTSIAIKFYVIMRNHEREIAESRNQIIDDAQETGGPCSMFCL